jgi:hypothetical protein
MALSALDPQVLGRLRESSMAEAGPAEGAGSCEAHNLTVSEARDLLDWLEARGILSSQVETDADGRMTIRWAC